MAQKHIEFSGDRQYRLNDIALYLVDKENKEKILGNISLLSKYLEEQNQIYGKSRIQLSIKTALVLENGTFGDATTKSIAIFQSPYDSKLVKLAVDIKGKGRSKAIKKLNKAVLEHLYYQYHQRANERANRVMNAPFDRTQQTREYKTKRRFQSPK